MQRGEYDPAGYDIRRLEHFRRAVALQRALDNLRRRARRLMRVPAGRPIGPKRRRALYVVRNRLVFVCDQLRAFVRDGYPPATPAD